MPLDCFPSLKIELWIVSSFTTRCRGKAMIVLIYKLAWSGPDSCRLPALACTFEINWTACYACDDLTSEWQAASDQNKLDNAANPTLRKKNKRKNQAGCGVRVMANKNSGVNNLPGLQRSLRKSNAKRPTVIISRRTSQSTIEKSASPVPAAQKRKRTTTPEEELEGLPACKKNVVREGCHGNYGQIREEI